jgi:hypothetical protein
LQSCGQRVDIQCRAGRELHIVQLRLRAQIPPPSLAEEQRANA